MKIVGDGLVRPGDGAFERIHHRHMHDRPDVGEVALRDSEVQGTERLRGHNACTILQVGKPVLQHVVHLRKITVKEQKAELADGKAEQCSPLGQKQSC